MSDLAPVKQIVRTTCCYCGVGCGVAAVVEAGELISVSGDKAHPANQGRLCVKGSALADTQDEKGRLLKPRVQGEETDWDSALSYVAERFQQIIAQHGPDSVAFYLSGQLLTEDYYVANKLAKGFIGTANIDTNSRLCMASAVVAHKRAFGGDLVPACYEDLELADVLFLVGSNTAYAHPIVYQRIAQARAQRPEMKIVVVDPRRTATTDIADVHLALRPGSDAFFFNGLLCYLAQNGALDEDYINDHCDGFEEALQAAEAQSGSVEAAAAHCNLPVAELLEAYQLFAQNGRVVTLFSQGINQSSSGVDKGNAIINCHLATGKIGKPGAAPFSITGQPNAMGGREVGGLANQLAAHMTFGSDADLDRVRRFWDAPRLAQKEGLKAVDMFQAIEEGRVKAVWIMATNPAVSMPNADKVKRALVGCDLVVVSECTADTDTARLADVLLPATTWSEKNGTVTNSERCISLQKGFLTPPGEALHDWEIICRFARKMGYGESFDYSHPVQIFREHAALSAFENSGERGFDIGALQNISESQYQSFEPVQWPVTPWMPKGSRRLFEDGLFFTPNRRARLVPIAARLPAVDPGPRQVIMNTGRIRDQWHTMSRTGKAARLLSHSDEPFVEVSSFDADRFSLLEGGLAELENGGSRYLGRVKITASQRPGEVFVPMHWNDQYAASSRADALVSDVVDPISGQPEFKQCPVNIAPFSQAWSGLLYCIHDLAPRADYWAKIPISNGFKYRVASRTHCNWRKWLDEQFPAVEDWTRLADSAGQFYRAAGFIDHRLAAIFCAAVGGDSAAENPWLEQQLNQQQDAMARLAILAGGLGANLEDTGPVICSCFQVGEHSIRKAIGEGCTSVGALGERLKCGTNCGSCIPELNALLNC